MSTETVATFGKVSVGTETAAGAAYVRKVTHPPSTIPLEFGGVPDASAPNMVQMEVKGEQNVPTSYERPTSATTTEIDAVGRMLFLTPSGDFVGSYSFCWTGNSWVQPVNQVATIGVGAVPLITANVPAVTNSGYNFDNFSGDVAQHRTTYKSSTFYLNATEFNNQGTVTSAKFKPSIVTGTIDSLTRDMSLKERKSFYKAIDMNDNDFADGTQTSDYAVQIYDVPFMTSANVLHPALGGGDVYINVFPNTPSDVMVISPKGNTRPAKDGAFVVQQPLESTQPWTQCLDTTRAFGTITPFGGVLSVIRVNVGSGYEFGSLKNSTAPINTGPPTHNGDTAWNNLDWSLTMFDGLSLPGVGSTVSPAYITIKTYTGFEISPRFRSSLLPFLKMLPMPDPVALQMAVGIFHARPDSLPASANDLGTIAATVVKHIPTVVGWLKGLFGSKPAQEAAIGVAKRFISGSPKTSKDNIAPKTRPTKALKKVEKVDNKLANQVRQLTAQVRNMHTGGTTLPTYHNSTREMQPPKQQRPQFARQPAPRTAHVRKLRQRLH